MPTELSVEFFDSLVQILFFWAAPIKLYMFMTWILVGVCVSSMKFIPGILMLLSRIRSTHRHFVSIIYITIVLMFRGQSTLHYHLVPMTCFWPVQYLTALNCGTYGHASKYMSCHCWSPDPYHHIQLLQSVWSSRWILPPIRGHLQPLWPVCRLWIWKQICKL